MSYLKSKRNALARIRDEKIKNHNLEVGYSKNEDYEFLNKKEFPRSKNKNKELNKKKKNIINRSIKCTDTYGYDKYDLNKKESSEHYKKLFNYKDRIKTETTNIHDERKRAFLKQKRLNLFIVFRTHYCGRDTQRNKSKKNDQPIIGNLQPFVASKNKTNLPYGGSTNLSIYPRARGPPTREKGFGDRVRPGTKVRALGHSVALSKRKTNGIERLLRNKRVRVSYVREKISICSYDGRYLLMIMTKEKHNSKKKKIIDSRKINKLFSGRTLLLFFESVKKDTTTKTK